MKKKSKKSLSRMPGIIDAHTHAYPPEIFANPVKWAKARGEHHWAQLVGPRPDGKKSLQGFATREQMLRAMDAAGVERCVLLGWYWEKQETCRWHNLEMAKWLKASPDRFTIFASAQPLAGKVVLDDLKFARDTGFAGIGEIFPAAQSFAMDNPIWEKVLAWAAQEKMPVNLHVPEAAGRDYHGFVGAPLRDYQRLARKHPQTTFIFAHWGGLLPLLALHPAVKKDLQNVYYDTAASPLLYDQRVYRTVVDAVGAERILFGTDYPLRVFPKEQKEPDFSRPLNEVKKSGLTKKELALVLGGNARKLLGIK